MILSSLLRWRVRLAAASLRGRGGKRRVFQVILFSWVAALFLVGSTVWFRAILKDVDLAPWGPAAIFAVLHGALLLSLVRDMGAAIGHLFLATDVPLLLSAPTRPRPLVMLRAAEALADACSFPAPLVIPVLWGYGIASGAAWPYYVAAPLAMVGLLCLSVLLGFLVSLWIAPHVPVGKARSWIRGASALLYLALWTALTWWNVTGARHPEAMAGAFGGAAMWASAGPIGWTPSAWAARGLVSLAAGEPVLAPVALLAGLVAALALLLALAAPAYPEAWQRSQELARRSETKRGRASLPSRREVTRPAPASAPRTHRPGLGSGLALVPAFFRRDLKLFTRDSALVWDIGLLVFMSSVLPLLAAPVLAGHVSWIVLPALVFFATELGFDLASRALPLERRALPWSLRAPVAPAALSTARIASIWLLGAPLVAALALLATWGVGLGAARAGQHAVLGLAAFTAMVPVGFAAGVFFGQAEWRHPRQMLNLGGRLLLAGILVVLSLVMFLVFAESGPGATPQLALSSLAVPVVAGVLVLDALMIGAAAARLHRFEWLN